MNGPTMPEFLHGLLQTNQSGNGTAPSDPSYASIEVRNYAYGWATVFGADGQQPNGTMSVSQQIATYLEDLVANTTAADASRRSMVPIQMGQLDVFLAWERYLNQQSAYSNRKDLAIQTVQQAARQLLIELATLLSTPADPKPSPDFVILPLYPLELAPRAGRLAEMYGSDTNFLKDLTVEYNKALMDAARRLSTTRGFTGNVFSVDVYE